MSDAEVIRTYRSRFMADSAAKTPAESREDAEQRRLSLLGGVRISTGATEHKPKNGPTESLEVEREV